MLRISDDSDSAICNLAFFLIQEFGELLICGRRNHERIAKLVCLCCLIHCTIGIQVLHVLIIVVYGND